MSSAWTRRRFLRATLSTTGGLLVGFRLHAAPGGSEEGPPSEAVALNAYVEIVPDGDVILTAPLPEIGQGVRTALPRILAEELSVDWSRVRVVQAEADPRYGSMGVGGSDSVADYWQPLRQAGATARELLVRAAAQTWDCDPAECKAEIGRVRHVPTGRSRPYGELAAAAAELPLPEPEEIRLRDPEDFRLIGRSAPGVDVDDMVTGRATYGLDVRLPGMAFAVVARCPVHEGRVESFDARAALRVPGVRQVVEIEPRRLEGNRYGAVRGGVAVIADHTWAAMQGREALTVQWEEGPHREASTEAIRRRFHELRENPEATRVRVDGDVETTWTRAERTLEADYELPLLPHVCMEPMNFTARVSGEGAELWGPTQNPRSLQSMAAAMLGLPEDAVRVHVSLAGGGFGRRLAYDYGVEAALVARAAGRPVQVVWSREDDVRHDFFRTPSHHRLRAGLDAKGRVTCWRHHLLTGSLRRHILGPEAEPAELYDVAGAVDLPYADLPVVEVEHTPVEIGVQLGSWRSVSHSFTVFAVESFLDEIAAAADRDPLDLRLELLGSPRQVSLELPLPGRRGRPNWHTGRLRRVLETAAEAADWRRSRPAGTALGLAACVYKRTYAAHVAQVRVHADGKIEIQRIVAALDCGRVVNPTGVVAQIEGAAMDGVATVLYWQARVEDGRVHSSNFHDVGALRLGEAPEVEAHLVPSDEPPAGVGEPPYPSVAPAIVNAIFRATGRRLRSLPVGVRI